MRWAAGIPPWTPGSPRSTRTCRSTWWRRAPSTSPSRTTGTSRHCPPRRARSRRSSGTTCAICSSPRGIPSPGGRPYGGRSWAARGGSAGRRGGSGRLDPHDWLLRTLRAAGHEPDSVHRADENPALVALVAAGLGAALIPRLGRGPLPGGVVEAPRRAAARRGRRGGGRAARPDAGAAAVRAAADGGGAASGHRGRRPGARRAGAGRRRRLIRPVDLLFPPAYRLAEIRAGSGTRAGPCPSNRRPPESHHGAVSALATGCDR